MHGNGSICILFTVKRLGVNVIPTIEEVNIFKDDSVIQFLNPVQASIASNRWIACGFPKKKVILCSFYLLMYMLSFCLFELQDILPGIINQLGSDNLENLRKLAENLKNKV
ncbi:hypothetical protein MKX03_016331 [Papaver bracteatum]|nr:hypothetical protein MKX03_016331 [Papaver bracteatum]